RYGNCYGRAIYSSGQCKRDLAVSTEPKPYRIFEQLGETVQSLFVGALKGRGIRRRPIPPESHFPAIQIQNCVRCWLKLANAIINCPIRIIAELKNNLACQFRQVDL